MNPEREDDLQHRLQQLEEEMNSSSPKVVVEQPEAQKQTSQLNFLAWKPHLERFKIWFKSLSVTGKLVVGGVSVLLGLAMLQAVFAPRCVCCQSGSVCPVSVSWIQIFCVGQLSTQAIVLLSSTINQ